MKKILVGMIAIAVLVGSASSGWAGGREKTPGGPSEIPSDPLTVEDVSGTDDHTVYIIFSHSVDAASIIENDSIQFYGTMDGLLSLRIQGELTPGLNRNVIKFTAKEDFIFSLVHTVKILGADSEDPTKAAVDSAQNKLEKEYVSNLLCVDKLPGGMATNGVLVCQQAEKAENSVPPGSKSAQLFVKSTQLLAGNRIIAVTFTTPVDVLSVIQNKSIALFVSPALFSIPLKGKLFAGLTSSPAFSDTVYFALDESEKEVHVHATGSGFVFAPYILKVYGLFYTDPSKAVKEASGASMAHDYTHTFLCGTNADTDEVTYVDNCKVF